MKALIRPQIYNDYLYLTTFIFPSATSIPNKHHYHTYQVHSAKMMSIKSQNLSKAGTSSKRVKETGG
jgi:hypothetical protein